MLLAGAFAATAVTVAMKWILIGRYRRSEHPLWCGFVWSDEMMNAAQEQLADERLLRLAIGTPLMSLYLRAMGARIGRGVWCETTAVTEHDMITLEDGTAVNRGGCLMTHLFHDRSAADRPRRTSIREPPSARPRLVPFRIPTWARTRECSGTRSCSGARSCRAARAGRS